jgi:hypothetical protein
MVRMRLEDLFFLAITLSTCEKFYYFFSLNVALPGLQGDLKTIIEKTNRNNILQQHARKQQQ